MSTQPAKVVILGPPDGNQDKFVSEISRVKVRSSTASPSSEHVVPMHFGKVKIAEGLDLQLFAAERDRADVIVDAISPVLGAIVVVDAADVADAHFAALAIDELNQRDIPFVVACDPSISDSSEVESVLNLTPGSSHLVDSFSREEIKSIFVKLLETVAGGAQGSAA